MINRIRCALGGAVIAVLLVTGRRGADPTESQR